MRLVVGLVPLVMVACASPNGVPKGTKTNDTQGPVLDLGGFLQVDEDLATPGAPDLASSSVDLASAAVDLATASDMATGGGSCAGGVTYAGSCSGYVLTYCSTSTNTVKTINCALAGNNCTVVSGDADCREPTTGCGPVTSGGLCDGNTLKYCSGGKIVKQDCGFFFTCHNDGSFADCY